MNAYDNDPVKILRVIGGLDPSFGGPPESAVAACLATEAAGVHNTLVFSTNASGKQAAQRLLTRLTAAGVNVRDFPVVPANSDHARRWGISPRLLFWMASNSDHDVIHIHGALGFATTSALLVGRVRRTPVVVSPHESLTQYDLDQSRTVIHRTSKRIIRRLYMRAADLLIFASQLEAEGSRGHALNPARDMVAPHPVTLRPPGCTAPDERVSDSLRIGFLGRLHPKKNVDVLIKALSALPSTIRLVIGGDGEAEEKTRLAAVAETAVVADRVEWRGWLDAGSRERFLNEVDVLAMPSEYECFGMAGAEALAHGLPAIVSETTGIADIVARHRCGIVTAATPASFAEAIASLVDDPAERTQMGARSLSAADAELSYSAYGNALAQRYRRLALRESGETE